jgi:hypothetical protein
LVFFSFLQNVLKEDFHRTCKGAFEIRGRLNYFWDLFSPFCPETPLFASLFISFNKFSTLVHLLWLDPHVGFLETLGLQFFGLHVCLFNLLIGFSPHFLWGLASFP